MSNNDDCWFVLLVIWRQFLYWILHHALTVRIQGRSGLVEYDNFRLSHESPRDRNPLFLSSAQISSLLSDWTIKPFGESFLIFEKLHASRTFSGIFDIFNAVVIEAVGDIVLDCSRKHSGILIDEAHLFAKVDCIYALLIVAAKEDASWLYFIELFDEFDDGGLARATLTHKGNVLSFVYFER